MKRTVTQALWLYRRLSRMHRGELRYRVRSAGRLFAQKSGIGTAKSPPPAVALSGNRASWLNQPTCLSEGAQAELFQRADRLIAGEIELFGRTCRFSGEAPAWNSDPLSGHDTTMGFGPMIDFRHMPGEFDIKFLWELNRHVWLTPLAQAWALSGERRYLDHLGALLRSWIDQCPYPQGPNWSSPVEHGIRLINWSILWHLIGGADSPLFDGKQGEALRTDWLRSIYQHVHFAQDNYSFYSSADNHLLGEAAGVFVGCLTWNLWPECDSWRDAARRILGEETLKQFAEDGVNKEQALNYQKFALEFLLAALLAGRAAGAPLSASFEERIASSLTFIAALTTASGEVPPIGDSDEGRAFDLNHQDGFSPFASLVGAGALLFDRADLARKAQLPDTQLEWLVPNAGYRLELLRQQSAAPLPRDFRKGGYVILGRALDEPDETRIVFDVGELGINGVGGHAHADALSLLLWHRGRPFLVDAGTYCYNSSPQLRRYFRGTSAHNTVEIKGEEQAEYGGSFLWLTEFASGTELCSLTAEEDRVRAWHDGYRRLYHPVRHVRDVRLEKPAGQIFVEDSIEGSCAHEIAVRWHFHPTCVVTLDKKEATIRNGDAEIAMEWDGEGLQARLARGEESPPLGWYSDRFYHRVATPSIEIAGRLEPGARLTTHFNLRDGHAADAAHAEAKA
jgi:hypothetical protein